MKGICEKKAYRMKVHQDQICSCICHFHIQFSLLQCVCMSVNPLVLLHTQVNSCHIKTLYLNIC